MTTARDRGSISVEMVLLVPAFVLLFALVVVVGRLQSTRADIEAAAHSAARTVTLSRDRTAATSVAHEATVTRLDVGGSSCRVLDWDVSSTTTDVTVSISCQVDLADVAVLPVPGSTTVSASSTEVYDRFTEQTG